MKQKTLTHDQLAQLCQGLALLLHAGLDLGSSLFLLAQEDSALAPLLQQLGKRLDEGIPLSQAMEESGSFPACAIGLTRTGEETGYLEEALTALAEYYRTRARTDLLLRRALTYPALLMLLMLAVIGVLLTQVLPVFDGVYSSLGGRLTGVSAVLLQLGQLLRQATPVLLAVLVCTAVLLLVFALSDGFRRRVSGLWRRARGDRGAARAFNNAHFARALAMGLGSGLPPLESARLASTLLSDIPGAAQRCQTCCTLLEQEQNLSDALARTQLLPPSQCRMLELGLKGGSGDRVMHDIAQRLMEQAELELSARSERVEPAMVLGATVLVGAILLSVMLPLVHIMSAIG